jgi:hypothetical protein
MRSRLKHLNGHIGVAGRDLFQGGGCEALGYLVGHERYISQINRTIVK